MTPLQKAKDAAVKEYIAKRNAAIAAQVGAVEAYKVVQDLYRFEVPIEARVYPEGSVGDILLKQQAKEEDK